uniref:Uncharacterized protein n=1 Tax=Falco tinnunculus TaxID=100819 RepID=A0A8C4XLA9_FALTI
MPTPGGVDVPHSSKGGLHPTCHLFQEYFEVGHFLLVDDNTAPWEERVPVAVHQHALHDRLREPRPLHARVSHAGGLRGSWAALGLPTPWLGEDSWREAPALPPPPRRPRQRAGLPATREGPAELP